MQYWDKYKVVSVENFIDWNTLKVENVSDGCYSVTYNMDFFIERVENNKAKKFNLDIILFYSLLI